MPGLVGCTVATRSHLAGARVVADSWRRLHPGAPFRILIADVDPADRDTGDDAILLPEDIGLDPVEVRIRRAIYRPQEYATSLKATIVRFLLGEGAEAVVFVDADSDVYAPLDGYAAEAMAAGVCLTAHVLEPLPADGRNPDELHLLKHGIVNTGLVAVGQAGMAFADWWVAWTRRDCLGLPEDGFLLDQRWVDYAPTQFGALVTRDPGLNVAHWNLHERRVLPSGDGWTVNGVPMRHFHFSWFDPEHPERLHRAQPSPPPRVTIDDQPELAGLLRDYADRVMAADYRRLLTAGYAFAVTAAGRPLEHRDRLLLREAVLAHEAGAAPAPPDPFDPAQRAAFDEFAATPLAQLPLSPQARTRLRWAHRILAEHGHVARRDRLTSMVQGAALRRIGISTRGLATASASVLAEY